MRSDRFVELYGMVSSTLIGESPFAGGDRPSRKHGLLPLGFMAFGRTMLRRSSRGVSLMVLDYSNPNQRSLTSPNDEPLVIIGSHEHGRSGRGHRRGSHFPDQLGGSLIHDRNGMSPLWCRRSRAQRQDQRAARLQEMPPGVPSETGRARGPGRTAGAEGRRQGGAPLARGWPWIPPRSMGSARSWRKSSCRTRRSSA